MAGLAPLQKNRYQIKPTSLGFDLKRRSDKAGERRAFARREFSAVRDDEATRALVCHGRIIIS